MALSLRGLGQFRDAFREVFLYEGALDVASLADGVGATVTATVPGVALGDFVLAWSLDVSVAGITVTAWVSAADTVSLRFQNESAGTVDLAAGTLRLVVAQKQRGVLFT